MKSEIKSEQELHVEIEALRLKFPNTQELYNEVCILLFFRFGIAPTANKLYQLVRKGSMSAPSEALGKFWSDLRERSRVRIEHPDLPEDLKNIAGEMISALWSKAQGQAEESFSALRSEAQSTAQEAEARARDAETECDTTHKELVSSSAAIEALRGKFHELEQVLAGEVSTRQALETQLASAQQDAVDQQKRIDEARRDFSSELEKLRVALKLTEDRYQAAETHALLEIDRERTISTKLQKDLELARSSAIKLADIHKDEVQALQDEIGNQKQRLGLIEGELRAVSGSKELLLVEIARERDLVRDLSTRLATAAHESKTWQQKVNDANREIDSLKAAKKRKSKVAVV